MEKESLEALTTNEYHVEYSLPAFWHRVIANLMDIIIFAFVTVGCLILTNRIIAATPDYKKQNEIVDSIRADSGLFLYESSRKTYELITTYFENTPEIEYPTRVVRCKKAINDFIAYVSESETNGTCVPGTYTEVLKDFDESRLKVTYEKTNLFILNDENVVVNNPDVTYNAEVYYKRFYKPYIQQVANGYLSTSFPSYYNSMKVLSNYLLFLELPVSLLVGGLLVYLLPTLIFRRERVTFGKKLFHIGLVDKNCLAVGFGRNLARFGIFFFGEIILSIFTFGVPLLFSFSMMAFTKNKQGFPDFMLRCTEIDNSKTKIFKSKFEAISEYTHLNKKPVDFKMKEGE